MHRWCPKRREILSAQKRPYWMWDCKKAAVNWGIMGVESIKSEWESMGKRRRWEIWCFIIFIHINLYFRLACEWNIKTWIKFLTTVKLVYSLNSRHLPDIFTPSEWTRLMWAIKTQSLCSHNGCHSIWKLVNAGQNITVTWTILWLHLFFADRLLLSPDNLSN